MIFFGDQFTTWDSLKQKFTSYKFRRLQQTHSDIIQEVTSISPEIGTEGDALWTREKNLALAVNTADCIPVLIQDREGGAIAAVHAGWRGVENRIIYKILREVFKGSSNLAIHLGPHIRFESFEVEKEVRDQLYLCVETAVPGAFKDLGNGKFLVDLTQLVTQQIREAYSGPVEIHQVQKDTKTNIQYFSHRRDPSNKGRQISFIAQD